MKETYLYICKYCQKEYKPSRRRVQKFCSDTCRSKNWYLMNVELKHTTLPNNISKPKIGKSKKEEKQSTKIEEISLHGIGNAAIGVTAVNTLNSFFTKDENKPATKGDLNQILKKLERYHPIKNLPNNAYGQVPHFDIYTNNLVYITEFKNPFESLNQ